MHRTLKRYVLFFILLLAACSKSKPAPLTDAFPGADAFPGWAPARDVEIFGRETIYNLVNGQAESFFAYGFEQVAVQSYENAEGERLGVEVWQLATPADAYGLFTVSISGEPVAIGNEGDAYSRRKLAFWQDRYYVHVRARQELDDADLWTLGEAVSAALPSGGERPELMDRLPTAGMVARSAVFFHEEMSIQNEVWLGGVNLLGLSQETDGALAWYDIGDGVARLLLVQYITPEAASTALAALESGQIDGFVTADVRDNLLGAIFGQVDEAAASGLLVQALDGR